MNTSDELKMYIDSKEHTGAFLLTGKWGCGKTYLIKNLKSEIDSDNKVMLIVSLFGVDSVEMLTKTIKEQILKIFIGITEDNQKINFIQKFTNAITSFSDKLSSIKVNVSLSINELIDIEKKAKILGKEKEIILVFDDFERSKLNTIELLGIINEFCENRQIKTIIIADEEKINNDKYSEFKEKVIQEVHILDVDYKTTISQIVAKFSASEKYRTFLSNNIELLNRVLLESGFNNLRTIKSILIGFERVFKASKAENLNEDILNDLFYSYSAITFEARNNNLKKNEYGYFNINDSTEKYDYYNKNGSALNSLKEYIGNSHWDEEQFLSEIKSRYFVEELSSVQKFLYYDFWELDGEIIAEGLPDCLELAYSGNLKLDEYISILNKIVTLTDFNYHLPVVCDYKKMISGLKMKKKKMIHDNDYEEKKRTFISDDRIKKLGDDAIELNKQIEIFQNKIQIWADRQKVIDELNSKSNLNIPFITVLDCFDQELQELLFKKYSDGKNDVRYDITRWLNNVKLDNQDCVTAEDIAETIKNLIALDDKMKILVSKESDCFNKIIHDNFIDLIEAKIEKLKKCKFR